MARKRKPSSKDIIKIIILILIVIFTAVRYFQQVEDAKLTDNVDAKYSYYFIDVGQGDCTLIKSDTATVVIDAGPGDHTPTTVEYIRQLTDHIDYLILTHPHEDHIGSADELINEIGVDTVIMPNISTETVAFEKVLNAIERNDCNVIEGKGGKSFTADDISIDLYGPNTDDLEDLNNASIIAKITTGEISAVFSGDAESSSEYSALEKFNSYEFDADIYQVGHHGSSTSTTDEFLDAISPEVAVISCGKRNSYGHPHDELLLALNDYGTKVLRTDISGTVIIKTDGEKMVISESYTSDEGYPLS